MVRVLRGTDPGLNRTAWRPVGSRQTMWVGPGPKVPAVPGRRWRELGGRVEELSDAGIERRYGLADCPEAAVPVGRNRIGEEVREHEGRRWIGIGDPAIRALGSWTGAEIAHQPTRALRFGSYQAWNDLAHWLVGQASRGQLSLDDDKL